MENKEQVISDGYKKALEDLLADGWNKRKATRYLDSIARKNYKKFIKKHKSSN